MDWSDADRQPFLSKLGNIEQALVRTYRCLLGLIVAGILAIVILVLIYRPWGAGNQGEWFYFSVAVFFALLCTIAKYVELGRRQRRRQSPASFDSSVEDGVHKWEFQLGAPRQQTGDDSGTGQEGVHFRLSKSFQIPLASAATDALPDEATIRHIGAELAAGAELDAVCRAVHPAYGDWNVAARWAYRQCVTNLLEQQSSTSDVD